MSETRQNFEFVGKNTGEEIDSAKKYLQDLESFAMEKTNGELEKTEQDITMIRLADQLVANFLKEINIPYEHMDPEHIHVLNEGGLKKIIPNLHNSSGTYSVMSRRITVEKDASHSKGLFIQKLIHELVHQASKTKFAIDDDNENDNGKISPYRNGYVASNKSGEGVYFRNLNEAVTEKIAVQIYIRNKDRIKNVLNLQDNQIGVTYMSQIDFLDDLIGKMAELRHEPRIDTWKRMERAYFTGEMMHLRDIEKVLGKGGLRKYAEENLGADITP